MATETLRIAKGPNKWDLMQAVFDPKPAQMHGQRDLTFTLDDGTYFHFIPLGLEWEPYPSLEPWTIKGVIMSPTPSDWDHDAHARVELKWDATRRTGEITVKIDDYQPPTD